MPPNCVQQQSCLAVVTAAFIDDRLVFELESGDGRFLTEKQSPKAVMWIILSVNVGYVSLGISRDAVMGEDSVMECVVENGIVRSYNSWNTPRGNHRVEVVSNLKIFGLFRRSLHEQSINKHD